MLGKKKRSNGSGLISSIKERAVAGAAWLTFWAHTQHLDQQRNKTYYISIQ